MNKIEALISRDVVQLTDPVGLLRNWDIITYLPLAGEDEMTHSFTSPTYDVPVSEKISLFKELQKKNK